MSSAQTGAGGEGESLPNYSDELVFKPSEQLLFSPSSSREANPPTTPAFWLSFKRSHVLKPGERFLMTSPRPAHFLLVWKHLEHVRYVREVGHFPSQVSRRQIASSSGGATRIGRLLRIEYSSNMYTN
ncbi:hypothetical protein PBY51_016640 [Eleginops maclovinus]|uniref:Uncharacterized protein n=1 Tax=Eleginops maclovinus TaxID=56733 RepID=A0AAN7WKT2_ELEMC|nr:hypothetical protein PBY51_016640 [Eleginops maclovinus]